MNLESVKLTVVVLLWLIVPPSVAAAARWPRVRLLLLALLVLSFATHPALSLSYLDGSRYNVRSWEFCWSELIAVGLIVSRLRDGASLTRLLSPLIGLWCAHLAVLVVSACQGIDGLTSTWYCWRMVRALIVMVAVAVNVRQREDVEAVICGMMLTCLWNEWRVLRQKYGGGIYQTPGVFDHQNAMSMYLILCSMVMLAAWLFRALRPGLRWPLFVAILCAGHSILCGLSRGSMAMYALALAATALSSLAIEPDRHKLRAVVLLAIVGGACTAWMTPTIIRRFNDRGNDISAETREYMNRTAAQMYDDHPLLGVGPNNYAEAVNLPRYAKITDMLDVKRGFQITANAHRGQVESIYYGLIAETGILGLASMLIYMAATVIAFAIKVAGARDKLARAFALGAFWALVANYLQCQLEHTLLHAQNAYLWSAIIGVGVALPWRRALPASDPTDASALPAAAAAAADRGGPTRPPAAAVAGAGSFWS